MTALLAWYNLAKVSTILAASQATDPYKVANDSGSPSQAWQTPQGAVSLATGAVLRIDPPSPDRTWRAAGLFRTNLTPSAVVQFSFRDDTLGEVANVTVSPVLGYGQVVAVLPADTVASYLTIIIDDPGNPDGFINVPLAFGGPAWFPSRSLGFSSSFGWDVAANVVTTRGGQETVSQLYRRRRFNVAFESLLESEVWDSVDEMWRTADTGSNVLLIPDIDSGQIQKQALFGRLKSVADVTFPFQSADRRRWSAQITERL